ncbi:glutathione S-transferase family protein [Halopseudomonas salegens]|uniref:Glutathione S-transferase n=1 Tax=Halopseudomonas salegens TaxID=1434072 RepID=A0A1H2ERX5_9GAMM|nr:glutathione S-transferase family protein [Halopseudomonas salegens]SDT97841.1 glutathione S-transferase [Halopseudomonas salegens]
MSLTLYGAILSPFVRKNRIQLADQSLDYELVAIDPFNQPEWFSEINPLRRVPALKTADGIIADSAIIAQYLHDSYPGSNLYGSTPTESARVRWLEKFADYELAPLATFTVFRNRLLNPVHGKDCDEDAVQHAMEHDLPPLLAYLEQQLEGKHWFLGEQFSLADIAVGSQLINLAHGGQLIDELQWPNLSCLLSKLSSRQSVSSLLPGEHQLVGKLREFAAKRQAG